MHRNGSVEASSWMVVGYCCVWRSGCVHARAGCRYGSYSREQCLPWARQDRGKLKTYILYFYPAYHATKQFWDTFPPEALSKMLGNLEETLLVKHVAGPDEIAEAYVFLMKYVIGHRKVEL